MITLNKEAQTTNFNQYGLTGPEISSLIQSINITINNYKKELPNQDMSKCPNIDIFNSWRLYNPQWANKGFDFFVEVIEYINSIKDEKGIFISTQISNSL